ncbi:MAG: coenzyme F420-0:L-glutamate ligase [Anaerolineae bacterium]|nr:coenzyme F420-0:L-glutamate ligase [Anaerolineae bacterium]
MTNSLHITAIPGLPIIQPGDDLPVLIAGALTAADLTLQDADVLVVTSKIVSKAEGRRVDLRTITPGDEALRLAEITRKDARVVELVLRESVEVSRARPGVLIVRHRLGFVSANAGIDQSNVAGDEDTVLLLPSDPDASAAALRERLSRLTGAHIGIVISDSHGRAWRVGNLGVAIGVSGLPAVRDLRGQPDLFGRRLQISIQGYADMIASAAGLLSGEANEGLPVVLVRGLTAQGDGHAADINRAIEFDLYR